MPVLTSNGPPAVTDMASRLVGDLTAGRTARQTINSEKATAFSWAAGLPMTLARVVTHATTDGLSFNAVQVKPSATPAGKVAERGTKPTAVTITSGQRSLSKYAGLGLISTEQQLDTDALVPALAAVIINGCVLAFDADCVAALDAEAGLSGTGASWPAAILDGISEVAAAGGAPDTLVIAAGDYAAVATSPGAGYAMNPTDGVPAMFGLSIVLSSNVAAGKAYVLDSSAVLAVEHEAGPLGICDPFSLMDTNEIRVAVEAFMAFVVTSPGAVCEITKTATVAATETSTKK